MAEFMTSIMVVYFLAALVVFLLFARHFFGWFINSTPPGGKLSSVVEIYTFWFHRHLTSEGIQHKKKCLLWLSIFTALVIVAFVGLEYLH